MQKIIEWLEKLKAEETEQNNTIAEQMQKYPFSPNIPALKNIVIDNRDTISLCDQAINILKQNS